MQKNVYNWAMHTSNQWQICYVKSPKLFEHWQSILCERKKTHPKNNHKLTSTLQLTAPNSLGGWFHVLVHTACVFFCKLWPHLE